MGVNAPMVDAVLAKIFGTRNEREVKAMRPVIAAINDLEPATQQLSDIDLAAKTIEFRERIARGESLDDLLIEAFAGGAGNRPPRAGTCGISTCSSSGGMVLHKKAASLK